MTDSKPFRLKQVRQSIPEKYIENQILSYLRGSGFFVWKNENVGVYDAKRGSFRSLGPYRMKGVPDILGILPGGRFLGIEVKNQRGVVSVDQKLVLEKMRELGAVAFVARSIEDVMKFVKELKGESK